ncbi:MAG: glycosyltransferase family 39 protein [Candidatus Altiarchaeota archaeon]
MILIEQEAATAFPPTLKGGVSCSILDEECKYLLMLAAVLAFTLLSRAYHAGDGIGGYHSWNEATYTLKAQDVLKNPLEYPSRGGFSFMSPPAYTYLLSLAFHLFGAGVFVGRMVSIAFSCVSLYLLYALGSRIYDRKVGLTAAAFACLIPLHVMVGRNIQTDIVVACFQLAALVAYLDWRKSKDARMLHLAAVTVGVGFWFKPTALLMMPVVAIYETVLARNIRWPTRQHIHALLIAAIITSPFIVWGLLTHRGQLGQVAEVVAGGHEASSLTNALDYYFSELLWGLSPPILLLLILYVITPIKRLSEHDLLPTTYLAVFLAFFLVYNYHSYYLLPVAFPAALLAAKVVCSITDGRLSQLFTAVILAFLLLNSLLMLGAQKYGYNALRDLPSKIRPGEGSAVVISDSVDGSYGPIVRYYLPGTEVIVQEGLNKSKVPPETYETKNVYVLANFNEIDAKNLPLEDQKELLKRALMKEYYGLSLGTHSIYVKFKSIHAFKLMGLEVMKNKQPMWGVQTLFVIPEFYAIESGNLA